MRPEFRPIALSVVDFLGSFLPGCIWLVVIHEYDLMFHRLGARSVFAPVLQILSTDQVADKTQTIGTFYYLALAGLAALLGFSVKPIAMRAAEWCSRPETWRHGGRDHRFPYKAEYQGKEYFRTIVEAVALRTGFSADVLPGQYQPFSACKRILRESRSALWEELEHAEAEARMLGSLFLAVAVSVVPVTSSLRWNWVLLWCVSTFCLGYGFRRARRREINYCYMNFLIASRAIDRVEPTGS
jgi:hypothetical protein